MDTDPKKKIIIAGASGFLGTGLKDFLIQEGFEVFSLVRKRSGDPQEIFWDPYKEMIDTQAFEGAFAVINLSGASIATRWTDKKKQEILESRVLTTRFLVSAFQKLSLKPLVFACASGAGFYGCHTSHVCDEDSPQGEGFLAEVCRQWENEAQKAEQFGIRTARLRFGVILSPKGGALKKMIPPFKLGLGGPIGDGSRYLCWIAYEDVLRAILHALTNKECSGPINICAPELTTNQMFTKALGRALKRPTCFPVPPFILKVIFGQMAEETILASQNVYPKKLTRSFTFLKGEIDKAFS